MKPAPFSYARPESLDAAVRLLGDSAGSAKVIAGGQSLGPMLNLRLAQPELILDITGIAELARVRDERDAVVYGACVTTAAIEDGRTPDPTNGFLRHVAGGIAFRAVRNRGTIGGSIAHADPAADWMTTLTALGAQVIIAGGSGERRVRLGQFMTMPYSVALEDDELMVGISVPKFSSSARFGYFKFCRKRGEFAEAMAAVVADQDLGIFRGVIGATDSRPVTLEDISEFLPATDESLERARRHVTALRIADEAVTDAMHGNAFSRALRQLRT